MTLTLNGHKIDFHALLPLWSGSESSYRGFNLASHVSSPDGSTTHYTFKAESLEKLPLWVWGVEPTV